MNFNPRPRKEGDSGDKSLFKFKQYFNPRPRKEGDLNAPDNTIVLIDISIHALVKRATNVNIGY